MSRARANCSEAPGSVLVGMSRLDFLIQIRPQHRRISGARRWPGGTDTGHHSAPQTDSKASAEVPGVPGNLFLAKINRPAEPQDF